MNRLKFTLRNGIFMPSNDKLSRDESVIGVEEARITWHLRHFDLALLALNRHT